MRDVLEYIQVWHQNLMNSNIYETSQKQTIGKQHFNATTIERLGDASHKKGTRLTRVLAVFPVSLRV